MSADAALVAAVQAIMERDGVAYPQALATLRREQPRAYTEWEDHLYLATTPSAEVEAGR
jgi:hypothetical protein